MIMRQLTTGEVKQLQTQRCWCEDWQKILVADNFSAANIRNSNFYGNVLIGSDVTITDVKMIKGSGKPFKPNAISVQNEGGDGNVVLCPQLTAQLAWLSIHYKAVFNMLYNEVQEGNGSRVQEVQIGDYATIEGASKIVDTTICSSKEAPTYIGTDVILEGSVIQKSAEVTNGAKVSESFVGEAVHIGKGFSSEASCFFANAYMDNGEACAALCGPFACSHHKSTLLIGGEFSFYNAGSNTNQSNHAYKMGPIHWGTLQRGSKTASGCHILWPATIGVFSMVMGKVATHPQIENLPFSYIFGDGEKTIVVPGINISTVGTWRDINKWPKRDGRVEGAKEDLITYNFLNPFVMQYVHEGKKILQDMLNCIVFDNEDEYVDYNGCLIKKKSLQKGIDYYTFIEELAGNTTTEEYLDLLGFVAKKASVENIVTKVENKEIDNTSALLSEVRALKEDYPAIDEDSEASHRWHEMIKADALKEYNMGDVDEDTYKDFIAKL